MIFLAQALPVMGVGVAAILSGCGQGRVNFEDNRPSVVAARTQNAPVLTSESKALRESQGQASWSLDTFKSFWTRFPESREQFLVNLEFLARADFDWPELTRDFALDREFSPSRKDLKSWGYIVEILRAKHAQRRTRDDEWTQLTLQAPLPIGLRALFESRTKAETGRFSDALWAHVLIVLKNERPRALGSGVWLNFLHMLENETEFGNGEIELARDDRFWNARRAENVDKAPELNRLLTQVRLKIDALENVMIKSGQAK